MTVFLSHAEFDAAMAAKVKELIEAAIPGVSVFVSSDPGSLQAGDKRFAKISTAIEDAAVLVILATERSLDRPWVWFEAGMFWLTDKLVIAICLGSVRKGGLPWPLCDRKMLNGEDATDLSELLKSVSAKLGARITGIDTAPYARSLSELEMRARDLAVRNLAGWLGAEWGEDFLAFAGPVKGLPMIEDAIFTQSMADALSAAGLRPLLANPHNPLGMTRHFDQGARVIHLTDRKSWRQQVRQGDTILIAYPPDVPVAE